MIRPAVITLAGFLADEMLRANKTHAITAGAAHTVFTELLEAARDYARADLPIGQMHSAKQRLKKAIAAADAPVAFDVGTPDASPVTPDRTYPAITPLEHVLAQVAHFHVDNFSQDSGDDALLVDWENQHLVGYVLACLLAQHTKRGRDGVETEFGATAMQLGVRMDYTSRVMLAKAAIAQLGGAL